MNAESDNSPAPEPNAAPTALLQTMLDGVDDGLALFAPSGRLIFHNRPLADLCQADTREMAALQSRDAIEVHLANVMRAQVITPLEGAPLLLAGAERVIEVRRRPVDNGEIAIYRDVTAQHRTEDELRHAKEGAEIANRSKSAFLANTSHELRTPLNAIIGFSEMLRGEMFGPLGSPRYLEYIKDIHASGLHLLGIINDLLDLAKIEAGRFDLIEKTVSIGDIVDASLRLVAPRAHENQQTLRADLAADLPAIRADDRALTQVLANLLSNAVKFTPKGGEIVVAARAEPEQGLELVVIDNGIGISPNDIEIALTPFGQIDAAFSRRYPGTGLGLPMAKHLVELHQGTMQIESNPGAGTRVRVQLPAKRITLAATP